jgi:Tol biopolymer transport system component
MDELPRRPWRGGGKPAEGPVSEAPKRQIWLLRASGGEAFRLTGAKEGIDSYQWSPDGSRIAFVAKDPVSEEEEGKRKRRDDPKVYEGDSRMSHLWTIGIETREAVQRTRGAAFTVKGRPSFSPDGSRVAFAASPTLWLRDGRDDVYVLTLEGDKVEKITSNLGQDESPVFSPDGKTIAFPPLPTTPSRSRTNPDPRSEEREAGALRSRRRR